MNSTLSQSIERHSKGAGDESMIDRAVQRGMVYTYRSYFPLFWGK